MDKQEDSEKHFKLCGKYMIKLALTCVWQQEIELPEHS